MWKCPNCETLNDGEFCVICGEKKEAAEVAAKEAAEEQCVNKLQGALNPELPETAEDEYRDTDGDEASYVCTSSAWRGILIVVGIILMIAGIILFATNARYNEAKELLESGNYNEAKEIFTSLQWFRDSNDMLLECDYKQAVYMMENGIYDVAKRLFYSLGDYKDSSDMITECDYIYAVSLFNSGNLPQACALFEMLGDYKDSEYQAMEIQYKMYDEGVKNYRYGNYALARSCFEESYFGADKDKYLRLIDVHEGKSDASTIYDLAGFEDAEDIIFESGDAEVFLLGHWSDSSGEYIEFYENQNDNGDIWCRTSLKTTDGKYYYLQGNIHQYGDDENGYVDEWRYDMLDEDTMSVYHYLKDRTYTLTRR